MEDHQYGMADLRQYITGRPFFPSISPPPALPSTHRNLTSNHHHYDMLMFPSSSTSITPGTTTTAHSTAGGCLTGFGMDAGGPVGGGGDGGLGRWPRQETLTLLEIRSRLDPKFKEANHKGPLWDEVSRIMSEEYGYQRSGKKCREKFENLYKYYKKTKEGKAGRQDGKHYRFFRQLEALYGHDPTSNNNSASVSETRFLGGDNFQYDLPKVSISSYSDTISSDDHMSEPYLGPNICTNDRKKKKCSIKSKIKESIDAHMRKLMEKQEVWMEKMMRTIEDKEKERILREEQWRKQDDDRIERERKLWASERAWIEARDATLMDAFRKLTGKESSTCENQNSVRCDVWGECEITRQQGEENVINEGCFRYFNGDI
ncbi:hypothetical protein DH2020_039865 [Rehmannia glutinosa]|uniref:Myb-like domain-containing protein n=1 Tax=Rehmannia glutinosa TaxID=99300 RepID=A0ABR0UWD7_REHGL